MSCVACTSTAQPGPSIPGSQSPTPADAQARLAKYRSQLADWVDCTSSKTPAGKARIDQISRQIDALKAQISKAQQAAQQVPPSRTPTTEATAATGAQPPPRTRSDGLSAFVDLQA